MQKTTYDEVTYFDVIGYNRYEYGAITICTKHGNYACEGKDFKKYFPNLDLRKLKGIVQKSKWAFCDYCVNHYGLDFCSCGNGEKVGKCECGSTKPMQKVDKYIRVNVQNLLLAG